VWIAFHLGSQPPQGDMTTDVAARTKRCGTHTTQTEGATLRQQGHHPHSDGSIRHTSAVSWPVLCYPERQPSRHRKLEAVNLKILRRIVPGAYAATPLEELITLAANHGCLILTLECRIYQICLRYIGHVERMENDARRNTCSTAPWPSQT
jgi:hypothetical protein